MKRKITQLDTNELTAVYSLVLLSRNGNNLFCSNNRNNAFQNGYYKNSYKNNTIKKIKK